MRSSVPYKDNIIERFNNIGDILHHLEQLDNPLQEIINKMRVSYKTGGFFCLKRVRSQLTQGTTYLDYEILVDSIEDKQKLKQLYELHK